MPSPITSGNFSTLALFSLTLFLIPLNATSDSGDTQWEGEIIDGNPNMRSGPDGSYTVIAVLLKGTQVDVISPDPNNGYIYISYSGKSGYVWESFIKISEKQGTTPPDSSQSIGKIINGNPYLRTGAGGSYSVIKTLLRDEEVKILNENAINGYLHVKHLGNEGYVWNGFVQVIINPDPDPDPDPDPNPNPNGFSYPVGNKIDPPVAGVGDPYGDSGWRVIQVLGHYWQAKNPNGSTKWEGRHLAQDIRLQAPGPWPSDGKATIGQPVYTIGSGVVKYVGRVIGGTYHEVVMVEHNLGDEDGDGSDDYVCSFYGHLEGTSHLKAGDTLKRGDQIGRIVDWSIADTSGFSDSGNTHLHYVVVSKEFCEYSTASFLRDRRTRMCGYDAGGSLGIHTLHQEPEVYDPEGHKCEMSSYPNMKFYSPSQFIEKRFFQQ